MTWRLSSRVPVDIEVGIDADDALDAEQCGGFGDWDIGQMAAAMGGRSVGVCTQPVISE